MDLREIFPLKIESEDSGLRIDVLLTKKFPKISRSRWKGLIAKELLFVNDNPLVNASYILKAGEILDFDQALTSEVFQEVDPKTLLENLPRFVGVKPQVIADEENYIVISKPVGLAVHPGAGLKFDQTLVCWALNEKFISSTENYDSLLAWGDDVVEEFRPGIVHRLDQPTSGLLVIAKNPEAHQQLAVQFSAHTAQRLYYALVSGHLGQLEKRLPRRVTDFLLKRPCPLALKREVSGLVSLVAFLRRDPVNRTRFHVSPSITDGKKSISHFAPITAPIPDKIGVPMTWVEAKLETGRTHQIRVSLEFLGLPVVGDLVYGGVHADRMFLHAHHLEFDDPKTRKRKSYEAGWPKSDKKFLTDLGVSYPETSFFNPKKK